MNKSKAGDLGNLKEQAGLQVLMKLEDLSVYIIKRCPHKSEELKEKKKRKGY